MAINPGYSAIRGRPCSLGDLLAKVREFGVDDWILHLSRLATLLAGSRHRPGQYGDAFFTYLVPEDDIRFRSWFKMVSSKGAKPFLFTDRHVGILIELALLHAPRDPTKKIPPGGHVLDALLMLVDLETPEQLPQTDAAWAVFMATIGQRSRLVEAVACATRGYFLYQIGRDNKSSSALEWSRLFGEATKSQLDAYFIGGLLALGVTVLKKPQEIAGIVEPLPSAPATDADHLMHGVPDAYYALRSASIEAIANETRRWEKNPNPVEFNLIALRKKPLYVKNGAGPYTLFLSGLADSLCEGVYQEIITASVGDQVSESVQDVGSLFGYLFEEYVLELLEEVFPRERLLKRPRRKDNGREGADAIILYPEGLIVLQIKGRHVPGTDRYAWKSEADLDEVIRRTGLVEAVEQFVERDSIRSCRKGLVEGLSFRDCALIPIQPLAVTYESVPFEGLPIPKMRDLRERVRLDPYTRPLVAVDVQEIEALCSLPSSDTVWRVLAQYITSPEGQPRPIRNFLHDTGKLLDTAIDARWERTLASVIRQLKPEPR